MQMRAPAILFAHSLVCACIGIVNVHLFAPSRFLALCNALAMMEVRGIQRRLLTEENIFTTSQSQYVLLLSLVPRDFLLSV